MEKYIPNPINLDDVQLPDDILHLSELISKNVHEVWAKKRFEEGWTYGPKRNETLKQTPCMVKYEDLTEEEKSYDRNTSLETLKLIIKLGYKLEKIK